MRTRAHSPDRGGSGGWNLMLTRKWSIKPLLVVSVGPGTNTKYGSHWNESLIAT